MKISIPFFMPIFLVVGVRGIAQTDSIYRDTGVQKNYFIAIPVAFYSDETNLGFGTSAGYYFGARNGKVSNIQGNAVYTLKNQYGFSILPKIYTNNQTQYYSGYVKANYYPDKYYGIGRNTNDSVREDYTSKDFSLLVQWQRMVFGKFMVGFQSQVNYYKVLDIEQNGLLANEITDVNKKVTIGMGLLFTRDTRSSTFYPSTGNFTKISYMAYSKIMGSELNFTRLTADFRNFFTLGRVPVLAFQLYGDFTWGEPPFQLMPMLGGGDILRGFYRGRYRDDMMLCAQVEYRFPIHKRLKGTAFVSAGDVSKDFKDFSLTGPKYSYGVGLRVKVNPVNVHIRLDVAFTGQNDPAVYFTANEAF
ncbi:MAG: BamA/TamA family outer membrane protein [Bacteroidales bacterium]